MMSFSNLSNASTQPSFINFPPQFPMPIIRQPQIADIVVYSSALVLNTDEPLEIVAEKAITESYENLLSFSIRPLCGKLKPKTSVELPCIVALKGEAVDLDIIEKNRQGLDLIFVVDMSGSMGSGKIELVKITMEFVITLLKNFDRVSVIGFSDSAFIYCPLTVMNEQGKVKITQIINTLGPTGGTHIECGVRAALHMLADRKVCNQLTSILLLSDGCDNNTRSVNQRIQVAIDEFKPRIKDSYRMHTFGYGKDHDSVVMNLMADLTNGNFYYIENEASVTDAFANCMGEIFALLASNVQVSLTTKACEVPFKLSKVYSNTGDTVFGMSNVFFSDEKDSVFVLEFEAIQENLVGQKIVPVEAVATFTLKNGEKARKNAVLELFIVGNDEEIKKDEKVLLEYYRVKGAESLKQVMKFADAGKFEEAKEAARISEEEISNSQVANNIKIQALIKDLRDSQKRSESKKSWNSGGRAQVTSIQSSHFNQIAMSNCMTYQMPMQCAYTVSSNAYMSSKSAPANYSQSNPLSLNIPPPIMSQNPSLNSVPNNSGFIPPQVPSPPQVFPSFAQPYMQNPLNFHVPPMPYQQASNNASIPSVFGPQVQVINQVHRPEIPINLNPHQQLPPKNNS
ncbi:hypothetical protein SteCoe_29981 [Stentor coeruleus]|uniref:VWFA domain-containing protein n=1 Tax=Stentor coeruleus TaxID=5963 RepID=A0A1R2B4N5_9CILI|nr:hypothetical protein SteCoe_29981 [Stentor coeruleus]